MDGLSNDECIVKADLYGNRAEAYRDNRLIADQYYYGDEWYFHVPTGESPVTVKISPLYPEDDIYFECERKNGAALVSRNVVTV